MQTDTRMTDPLLETWVEAVDEFPLTGTRAAKLRAAIRYATLAPSSHNTQPWLFTLRDDSVELYADRARGLAVADPDDRELIMSCGAALYYLRLALAYFGCKTVVRLLPDPDDPDRLADIAIKGEHAATDEERGLFAQIPHRRTNRGPFRAEEVPAGLLAALHSAVVREGAWLVVTADLERKAWLADLIASADRRQLADRRFRRELAAWVRPNTSARKDGIPGGSLGLGTLASLGAPLVLRTFDIGDGQAARDRELALGSPVLAVLGTRDDTPQDLMQAGQALAHLLLLARASGVEASFLNQPVEVDDLRPALERVVEAPGRAQLVLRLGYGKPVPATPRRPVEEVLAP